MSDTFCILPWVHLQINNEGTAKLCCKAHYSVLQDGQPMSLYLHSLQEIWESEYMRQVRRAMVEGKTLPECMRCYESEQTIKYSYRNYSNEKWLPELGLSVEEIKKRAIAADFREERPPGYIQLNLGNLCNLKCRMCTSSYSLPIARDKVHGKWAPPVAENADQLGRWSEDRVSLCPMVVRGSELKGLGPVVQQFGGPVRWTSSRASLRVPMRPDTKLAKLAVRLRLPRPHVQYLKLSVNGRVVHRGPIWGKVWARTFDLHGVESGEHLEVRLECPPWRRWLGRPVAGFAVEQLEVQRIPVTGNLAVLSDTCSSRFPGNAAWFEQEQFVFEDLLGNAAAIRELYFTGGEPLIIPSVHQIIDHLVERGLASQVTLQFNTNCTKLREDFLQKLEKFRHVHFTLSLDAAGAAYEYIRYPARWSVIAENVRRLRQLKNAYLTAGPVLQMYNVLDLVDLFRFCDEVGIAFFIADLGGPTWLDVRILPPKVRALAAERFERYAAEECRPEFRHMVRQYAGVLRDIPAEACTPEMLRTFMLFTNDLDVTRRQSFRATHPELLRMIEETGFSWTDETRHAPRAAA